MIPRLTTAGVCCLADIYAAATATKCPVAGDADGLAAITKGISLHFKIVSKHTEITGALAAVAALLLVTGAFLSLRWFGRVM